LQDNPYSYTLYRNAFLTLLRWRISKLKRRLLLLERTIINHRKRNPNILSSLMCLLLTL
jgi:hypothetical protein